MRARSNRALPGLLVALGLTIGLWPVESARAIRLAESGNADLAKRIDAYARPLADAGELSGTLLVARGDTVVYERSFGLASVELQVPNAPTTRFGVASITKPMTAIAAVHLIEQGRLAPEDSLAKWIPDFPRGSEITVRHLLDHRSGLPHRVTEKHEEAEPRTAADMVRLAARHELLFAPGSSEAYSSAGYSVLASVLERASGRPFEMLLDEIVFAPVGAVHSTSPGARRPIPGRALSYLRGPDGPVRAALKDLSFLVGAGSVYSTPRDLLAITRGLLRGTYGRLARERLVRESGIRWNGITNGYRAFVDHHGDQDLTVIFTGNYFTGAADLLRRDVPKLASGQAVPPPSTPRVTPTAMAPELQARLSGRYRLRPGAEESLVFAGPTLVMLGEWVLIPISDDAFFSPQDYATVRVATAADGAVDGLLWGDSDKAPLFRRIGP